MHFCLILPPCQYLNEILNNFNKVTDILCLKGQTTSEDIGSCCTQDKYWLLIPLPFEERERVNIKLWGFYGMWRSCKRRMVMLLKGLLCLITLYHWVYVSSDICSSRYIFWTDWFRPAKIMRAWSDGSHALPIVNTTLGWPNGLAIDWR